MRPTDPTAAISPGWHALGMHALDPGDPTQYLSASRNLFGAPGFHGRLYWIDVDLARQHGAEFIDRATLRADVDDLVRQGIIDESQANKWHWAQDQRSHRVPERHYVPEAFRDAEIPVFRGEREVLFRGEMPAEAIDDAPTRGLKLTGAAFTVAGAGFTVYDLVEAGTESVETGSARPLVDESARQAGSWGGAWAGMKTFGLAGGALGLNTGPGAIAFGIGGGLIGGVGGYFGAGWVVGRF